MIDKDKPLFYKNTGRPMEILEAVPLMQYRVRYSNGGEETLTGLELEQKATNERPKYQFNITANPQMQVVGKKETVQFRINRARWSSPSSHMNAAFQDLSVEQVRLLSEELARWVQDRDNE
jgi:hypothetical protein